jgi:hypothetical protein
MGGSDTGCTPAELADALMEPLVDVAQAATSAPTARVSDPVVTRAIRRLVVPADVIAGFSR